MKKCRDVKIPKRLKSRTPKFQTFRAFRTVAISQKPSRDWHFGNLRPKVLPFLLSDRYFSVIGRESLEENSRRIEMGEGRVALKRSRRFPDPHRTRCIGLVPSKQSLETSDDNASRGTFGHAAGEQSPSAYSARSSRFPFFPFFFAIVVAFWFCFVRFCSVPRSRPFARAFLPPCFLWKGNAVENYIGREHTESMGIRGQTLGIGERGGVSCGLLLFFNSARRGICSAVRLWLAFVCFF